MFYSSQWSSIENQHVVYVHRRYLVAVLNDCVLGELVIFVLVVQRFLVAFFVDQPVVVVLAFQGSLVPFSDPFFVGLSVAIVLAVQESLVAFYLDRPVIFVLAILWFLLGVCYNHGLFRLVDSMQRSLAVKL